MDRGWKSLCVGLLVAASFGAAFAQGVKLAGSATVANTVLSPNRERIEKASGQALQVATNETGKGLIDLSDRNADIAMISAPLDTAIAIADGAGRKLDAATLRVHELSTDDIVFAVHPSNPVGKLTLAQLRDIHTGKIANWKQVGGKDQPIAIYIAPPRSGTNAMVRKVVMGGADYAGGVKTMLSLARVADMLPGDEGGIGAIGRGFVKADGRLKVIDTPRITRPLALVTLGEPSARAKQVIDAFRQALAGGRSADIALACATQVKPEMPRKALQEGIEGVVRAQALIRDGAVREVTILSGPRAFHAAVREAMLQYKCGGGPGDVVAEQEFAFRRQAAD